MSQFKVGDRVVIVKSPLTPERVGTVTTIMSKLFAFEPIPMFAGITPPGTLVHRLDLVPVYGGKIVASRPEWLELYRPDHGERIEWTADLEKLCGRKESVSS